MNKKNMKQMLAMSLPQIAQSICIYMIIILLHPGYLGLLLGLNIIVLLHYLYSWRKHRYRRFKPIQLLKNCANDPIIVTVIYLISILLGPWGFYGTLVIVLLLSGYRITKNRAMYMDALRDIETSLWGKPLDRRQWEGQQLPKIKLTWRRKTMQHKKKVRPVPLWLAYASIIAFILMGVLAIVENIISALFILHAGADAMIFAGYLVGIIIAAAVVWMVPLLMMFTYIRKMQHSDAGAKG